MPHFWLIADIETSPKSTEKLEEDGKVSCPVCFNNTPIPMVKVITRREPVMISTINCQIRWRIEYRLNIPLVPLTSNGFYRFYTIT